jgi:uncharacterized protein YndB with AHSA1/START domain
MSSAKKPARAIADVTRGIVLATVEIAAPPERVFRALVDPEEVVRWWGSPDLYTLTAWSADLRVGGRWSSAGRGADGTDFTVEGEFLEIDRPRRLVQTWRPSWEPGPPSTIAYQLEAVGEGTLVTVRHDGFGDRAESCRGHANGWERVLGWLTGHLTPAPESRRYFFCRLIAPRPSFAMDMSPEEAALMKVHADYLRELLAAGKVIAFGPVGDPAGPWGMAVLRAKDDAEVASLLAADPTSKSARGFRWETLPMMTAVHA